MTQTAFRAIAKITFLAGNTTSEVVDVVGNKLGGVWVPVGFTGTTLTFEASPNPGPGEGALPFQQITDDAGTIYTATILAGQTAIFEATAMAIAPPRWMKFVTNNAPAGDTDLYLLMTN